MPLSLKDLSFEVDPPRVPEVAPVTTFEYPCLKDVREKIDAFAGALDIGIRATVNVPHGIAAVGDAGQIEVFAASGAIRGRNTDRLSRYDDERREWRDVEKVDGPDGLDFVLGAESSRAVTSLGLRMLAKAGIERQSDPRIVLERWAHLDEKGDEVDAGPGRATLAMTYSVGEVPLLGAGAKTNLHFDPGDGRPELARFFHVLRPVREAGEVRTTPIDAALPSLLAERWVSRDLREGEAHVSVTGATFGMLAAPAHLVQHHALPVLAVEGIVRGDLDGLDEIHFARYLPLYDEKDAAERGFAPFVEVAPGQLTPRSRPSRKDAA